MRRRILTAEPERVEELSKALSSPVRRRILNALATQERSIQELADHLGIPQSSCTVNVQTLELAGLLTTRNEPGAKGSRKICSVAYDEVILPVHSDRPLDAEKSLVMEMPIGLYTDYDTSGPCGLVGDSGMIGQIDRVESFLDPHRATAQLIWFTDGWVEYSFPLDIPPKRRVLSVSVSMELCSEFPGFKNAWPSDITLWIGTREIGTWRSPGDMGGRRGRLTPEWWNLENTQFGYLKEWRVTPEGSFIDGNRAGDVTTTDLDLASKRKVTTRIGIKEDAEYHGGINLFGRGFGNFPQDLTFTVELE